MTNSQTHSSAVHSNVSSRPIVFFGMLRTTPFATHNKLCLAELYAAKVQLS